MQHSFLNNTKFKQNVITKGILQTQQLCEQSEGQCPLFGEQGKLHKIDDDLTTMASQFVRMGIDDDYDSEIDTLMLQQCNVNDITVEDELLMPHPMHAPGTESVLALSQALNLIDTKLQFPFKRYYIYGTLYYNCDEAVNQTYVDAIVGKVFVYMNIVYGYIYDGEQLSDDLEQNKPDRHNIYVNDISNLTVPESDITSPKSSLNIMWVGTKKLGNFFLKKMFIHRYREEYPTLTFDTSEESVELVSADRPLFNWSYFAYAIDEK